MYSATQIFVANWLKWFWVERGLLGWPELTDIKPEIVLWMDDETLSDLEMALHELLADDSAKEGYEYAITILDVIENGYSDYTPKTKTNGYIKRRPNRKIIRNACAVA